MTHKPSNQIDAGSITRNALLQCKILPPEGSKLSKEERTAFDHLADEFSLDEMTDHKVSLIVVMAKALAFVEKEQALLVTEGAVVRSPQGCKVNPRLPAIATSLASILKLRTTLGLGNYSRSMRDIATMRKRVKAQEVSALSILNDPLISKPNHIS